MTKLFGGKNCKQDSSIYVYLVIVKVCVDEHILVQRWITKLIFLNLNMLRNYTIPTVQIKKINIVKTLAKLGKLFDNVNNCSIFAL